MESVSVSFAGIIDKEVVDPVNGVLSMSGFPFTLVSVKEIE